MVKLQTIHLNDKYLSSAWYILVLGLFCRFPLPTESSSSAAATSITCRDCTSDGTSSNPSTQECCVAPPTKLLLLQVIFRHGDRTPIFSYPTDPHRNSSLFKFHERRGALTRKGKVQAHELGSFLRSHYKEFLSQLLIPEDVYAQSSDMPRTIMTAQTCLAGMFPPCDDHLSGCENRWSREIRWQPIPVYPLPRDSDNKINMYRTKCPAYLAEFKRLLHCDLIQGFASKHKENFEYIQNHTGLPKVDLENVGQVYDTLFIQSLYDLPLPDWTEKVFPEPMKTMNDLGFQVLSGNRKMMKFFGGPLLKEVLENMRKLIKLSKYPNLMKTERAYQTIQSADGISRPKKVFLYSGHDTTISGFLSTLNLFDTHQPPYASAVMVELHENVIDYGRCINGRKTQYIVKVFYRNSTKVPPMEMIIPECGNPCHLDNLTRSVHDLLLVDWKGECNNVGWIGWITRPLTSAFYVIVGYLTRFVAFVLSCIC